MKHLLITGLLVGLTAACQKPPAEQQAENAAKSMQAGAQAMQQGAQAMQQGAPAAGAQPGAQSMAQGLQQMAAGFQQMAQTNANGAPIKPVDYEQLKALVPDMDGWTKGDVKGEELSTPIAYSHAQTEYQKAGARITLEITDSAMSQMLLAPMTMFLASGYSERSDDGFKRAEKISGQPAMEDWNVKSKHGEVTAVVGSRFIVQATGNDVDQLDPVLKTVQSVDFSKLTSLK